MTNDTFETRLSRLRRHGPLVLGVGLIVAVLAGLAHREPPGLLLITALAAAVSVGVGIGRHQRRLLVTADGVELRSWIGHRRVAFSEVSSYRYELESDDWWQTTNLGVLIVEAVFRFVACFTTRPLRALTRWVRYSKRERAFLEARLALFGRDGKELMAIEGGDGFLDVPFALDRIIADLHARPLAPFSIHPSIALDAIATLAIDGAETTFETATNRYTLETGRIPNLFLVAEGVARRGGRVTVQDAFVPSSLQPLLPA